MAKACQLFSGSKGNSIFISNGNAKILIDAGVSAKRMDEALHNIGEDGDDISAIFITHEHSDHIKGVRVFATRHNIPIFAHQNVIDQMIMSGDITNKMTANSITDNMELCGIEINPFTLSHDSSACVGYRFNLAGNRSISVCTDTGYVTDSARNTLLGTDMIFLESNHEITMLENGPYPYPLKQRILSDHGHLSNATCSQFANELVKNGTTRICLSHLSDENNHPEIARQTTLAVLNESGFKENIDFRLKVSAKINSERPIVL
jgi:phosphoribosyl 1,2-cyclic phosphodiesterase